MSKICIKFYFYCNLNIHYFLLGQTEDRQVFNRSNQPQIYMTPIKEYVMKLQLIVDSSSELFYFY